VITARVEGADAVQANLLARQERFLVALQRKILSLELRLQSKIQGNLAAGIGLKSRHGTSGLAGSVRVVEPVIEGQTVSGTVQGAGGTSWPGAMWERTGHGEIVPVSKKALHFFVGGKEIFTRFVSAQGPRPWMVPTFQEFKPTIISEIRQLTDNPGATSGE
jgi:hypothetical protein